MKKYLILCAISIPVLYAAYLNIFSDSVRIERLIRTGENAVIRADTDYIEKLISYDLEKREVFMDNMREFFRFHDVLDIKTVKKEIQLERRTANIALILLITSDIEGIGTVTGRQTVGIEMGENMSEKDRGWKIKRLILG